MKLQTIDLTKNYGNKVVVSNLNLTIEPGKILGLLGPNGAGKSTTIKMLSGQISPTSGAIIVDGKKYSSIPKEISRKIGVMPQELILWKDLTIEENLYYSATLYGLDRKKIKEKVTELVRVLNMERERKTLARNLSGGYQRRLNLAISIIHEPSLIFLDEPSPGIDAQSRRFLMDYIQELGNRPGQSVVLTDHYLEEAEKLSDYVVIIDQGQIIAEGTVAELKKTYGKADIVTVDLKENDNNKETRNKIIQAASKKKIDFSYSKNALRATIGDPLVALKTTISILDELKLEALNLSVKQPSLEDIFLMITGKDIRE